MDVAAFRRRCMRAVGAVKDVGDYKLARALTQPTAPFGGMSHSTIYNWLIGRAAVPETAAIIINKALEDLP